MHITPTTLRTDQLFGSESEQYIIPSYQRRYSWHRQQVVDLLEDIELLDNQDEHLMGTLVCLTGAHTAGLNQLEVVDGQQRLVTLAIIFRCIHERLNQTSSKDGACNLSRFLYAVDIKNKQLPKIVLDTLDAQDFDALSGRDDMCVESKNRELKSAFQIVRDWMDDSPDDDVKQYLHRLKNRTLIVRLEVNKAQDAFKLFETINNRGLRLSPTDIIKNFLLGNAARFGDDHLKRARSIWSKMLKYLDGTNPDNFFRQLMIAHTKSRVTNAYIVVTFKTMFMERVAEAEGLPERAFYVDDMDDDDSPDDGVSVEEKEVTRAHTGTAHPRVRFKSFLRELALAAETYSQIVLATTGKGQLDRHLHNLQMVKASQAYAYLMHLRIGGCNDRRFLVVLKLTESFLLRRHICRERTNETERLFAKLCSVDPESPVVKTKRAYREASPGDSRFCKAFSAAVYSQNTMERARYCLEMIELASYGGQEEELSILRGDSVHVEHIIPQKIRTKKAKSEFGDWVEYLGKSVDQHPDYVSRIGNLTLLAGQLNMAASNDPFARKKAEYLRSSIRMTKDLAKLNQFRLEQVKRRSTSLAREAVKLWPVPQ
jgi:hypothetical protein